MANESSNADPAAAVAAADARYTFDVTKLEELRKSSPWTDDPRYFKGVAIGPSAVMKMVSRLSHFEDHGLPVGGGGGGNPR